MTTARAPSALVEKGRISFGSWNEAPGSANLIDADRPFNYSVPRFLQRMRLKEWRAIQVGDEDCFLCAVLYDAKFISMASLDIWDRKKGEKHGFRKMFAGSRFQLPVSLDSGSTRIDSGGLGLSISVDAAARSLRLEASSEASRISGRERISLDLSFDFSRTGDSLFSVCLPFGPNRGMYSTKALMPASGKLVAERHGAGSFSHRFEAAKATGVLDDHKGYYPYRLHYDWVTGFGFDKTGRRIGFNLTDNQVEDQVRYNENRLWLDGEVHPLAPVKITRPFGRESAWNIQDTEGMVDLVFHPEAPHQIKVRLGLAEIDYEGPFGRFEGELRAATGEMIDAAPLYGMGEEKHVRM